MSKKIAVIMSVYKSDRIDFFIQAVRSILEQSVSCHLFIFKDGVLPSSFYKELDLLSRNPQVTILGSEVNRGLANSLNNLIDTVLTKDFDYIARMDSDDISYPTRLDKQVEFLKSNLDIDICGCFCREFGSSYAKQVKSLPLLHSDLLRFSITRCPFIHPTVMFRSSVFDNGLRYPVDTHLTEDMAFWFECLNNGKKFANLDQVLLDYRMEEDTVLRRKGLGKSISETKLRFTYMMKLNQFSFRNFLLISSRLAFHLMPSFLLKLSYKHLR
ncbi:glycosyltransferase [Vibrio kanaloae]|uniref:glycosyltransferase n=1 Tax=Vibrio kanaloae TaxID=170673 RepID=UPI0010BF4DB2|nr:glycosyltransferase [Vibrio kanaloae]TKF80565.1 glycosyltransferase [Vibrio kanaloae]